MSRGNGKKQHRHPKVLKSLNQRQQPGSRPSPAYEQLQPLALVQ